MDRESLVRLEGVVKGYMGGGVREVSVKRG